MDKYMPALANLRFQRTLHQVNFHEEAEKLQEDECLQALNLSKNEKT